MAPPVCSFTGCEREAPPLVVVEEPLDGNPVYGPGPCTMCPKHCKLEDCEIELHKDFRAMRLQSACRLNRYEVVDDHAGVCPCGAPVSSHPRPQQLPRLEAPEGRGAHSPLPPESPRATCPERPTAALYGLTAAEFNAHPVNFTTERWLALLTAIRGPSRERRVTEHRIRTLERQKAPREAAYESSVAELAAGCKFVSGHVREFAGLLATMTAVSTLNEAQLGPPVVAVPAASLMAGETGNIPAQDALNDVAVMRLVREGRQWFLAEAGRLKEKHKSAVVQYVGSDPKTSAKRAFAWTERYTKTLLISYSRFLQERPPTWALQALPVYLAEHWTLPLRDAVASIDLSAFFVQAGVLSLVDQCEEFEKLGDAMVALTAHVSASYVKWQEKFVLSSANLAEHKKLVQVPDKPATTKEKAKSDKPCWCSRAARRSKKI